MALKIALGLALALALALPAAAAATPACAERGDLARFLEREHGEILAGGGIASPAIRFELYARPDGRSWTIVAVRPDGVACMVAAGEHWEPVAPRPPGRPS